MDELLGRITDLHTAWLKKASEMEASDFHLYFKLDVVDAYRKCAAELAQLVAAGGDDRVP